MRFLPFSDGRKTAFNLRANTKNSRVLEIVVQPNGSLAVPRTIWSHRFDKIEDRDSLLNAADNGNLDTVFLGRLTMMFGSSALDERIDALIAASRVERAKDLEKEARRARDHLIVKLYARADKHGRNVLELQRKSSDVADWSVRFDRAIERDRLCDWLRWQKTRFLTFLDFAAEHGDEALARILVDEMFVTERRVKKEGRGAGGARPLRMWRGD